MEANIGNCKKGGDSIKYKYVTGRTACMANLKPTTRTGWHVLVYISLKPLVQKWDLEVQQGLTRQAPQHRYRRVIMSFYMYVITAQITFVQLAH